MTLEEFLSSPVRNAWIEEPGISIYVRKGIGRFDVANVHVHPNCQRQGLFKTWLAKAEALAAGKFDLLLLENVHNEVLIPFIERIGYVPHAVLFACYFKTLV